MSEPIHVHGACLCQSVRLETQIASGEMGVCHCSTCRKWTGSVMMAVHCHVENDLAWQGEENIGIYDSSEWAERGFCKQCGTHLFYRLKDKSFYGVPAGLLDEMAQLKFTSQIFVDEKPQNYDFSNNTAMLTGEEVFSQFEKDKA